mgnify:CR=1 FL=1
MSIEDFVKQAKGWHSIKELSYTEIFNAVNRFFENDTMKLKAYEFVLLCADYDNPEAMMKRFLSSGIKKITPDNSNRVRNIIHSGLYHEVAKDKDKTTERPRYINISFQATKNDLKKINSYIKKGKFHSFRDFIIEALSRTLKVEKPSFFCVKSSGIKSNQVLIPSDFLDLIVSRVGSEEEARKKVSAQISNIIKRLK